MTNPLKAHFRQPEIYLPLPSGGQYWPNGSLEMPPNKELPIFAMSAADEIALSTPDGLMNGSSIASLIGSCCPAIKDPWVTPIIDIEALLIATRIASAGNQLDLEVKCPGCKHLNEFAVDLRAQLDQLQMANWNENITLFGLTFSFRPLTLQESTTLDNKQFVIQKTIEQLSQIEDHELREETKHSTIRLTTELAVDTLVLSIQSINVNGQLVVEQEYIREFLNNCDRKIFNPLRDHVNELRISCKPKHINLTCDNCNLKFYVPLSLDYASFFV